MYVVDISVLNQSQSSDFRVKAAASEQNSIVARRPSDELPYVCQYKGSERFNVDTAEHQCCTLQ